MNKEWTALNKSMQQQIKKQETFHMGIETLLVLRKKIMQEIFTFREKLKQEDFCAMPFVNANGYHNKTIAYSLYHITRIEDIVVHSLIKKDEQVFFTGQYQSRMRSPIITTGNELLKQEVAEFSQQLDLNELYQYMMDVDNSTASLLKQLTYKDLKTKMIQQDKETLQTLQVVSEDENAVWLIDYWCNKNIQGLIQMPLSRHWIMHTEACLRIMNKLCKNCEVPV